MRQKIDISIVVPIYNERENISELHSRILKAAESITYSFEIIFIDDGSTDGTFEEIKKLNNVCAYSFVKNLGKSHAISFGIKKALGEIIVTLDGDLENHPEDIPKLVNKLDEGFDVATGWRKDRWRSSFLSRRVPSLVANWIISKLSKVQIHDHGCGLTAYRSNLFNDFDFPGEFHRMIVPYLSIEGANITEIPVNFTPRRHGKSKYGLTRTFKVVLDLLSYYFFKSYSSNPMHFFGFTGLFLVFLGAISFLWSLYLKIGQGINFNKTPLPELIAIFVVVGFQFILMGLLAEIFTRSFRSNSKNKDYKIKEEFID